MPHRGALVPNRSQINRSIQGEKWGAIVHDSSVSWLAYWKDPITNSFKYVYLGEGSRVKGEADKKKYEKARELKVLHAYGAPPNSTLLETHPSHSKRLH